MMSMMRDMARCSAIAGGIHSRISAVFGSSVGPMRPGAHSFRVSLNDEYSLSVSVPPDRMGNRTMDISPTNPYPSTYETALIRDTHVVYEDDWGYRDVCSFFSVDDIVDEIRRVMSIVGDGANPQSMA
jgi:hypothetical protein